MSTPIETNTEELQEILNTVYNLPMAGGGDNYDLVIGFNLDGVGVDDVNGTSPIYGEQLSLYSIVSGSVSAVADKLAQGKPTKVLLKLLQAYNENLWSIGDCEPFYVGFTGANTYPSNEYNQLCLYFVYGVNPAYYNLINPNALLLKYDLATGDLVWAEAGQVQVQT